MMMMFLAFMDESWRISHALLMKVSLPSMSPDPSGKNWLR